jgi:hypothetical protein
MPMDYRNMKEGWKPGDSPADQASGPGGRWWNIKDETSLGKSVMNVADSLKQQAQQRHQMNLVHARLYGNVDIISFGARDYARSPVTSGVIPNRIAFNIVATCIETLGSKIGKQRPRPSFQTSGASWPAQQRARRANLWTQGLFYETKIHEVAKKVRLAAYTFGTGALKVWVEKEEGEVHIEPAFIDDLYVDDADGIDGKPRQLFQRFLVDRDVLIARFPGKRMEIEQADSGQDDKPTNNTATRIEVWEGWHLPSGEKAGDGKHVIVTRGGAVLFSEPWKLDCFPFVFRRYRPRLQGFWGQGIAEILTGIQVELNRLVRSVSEQLRRRGRGRIFAQAGTVDEGQFDNSYSPIVKTKGPPGQVIMVDNQNAVAGEEFAQIDRLYQKGFQEVGLSELSVAAKKPAGLDAAVALREFNDIESERFALDAQADENFYLDFTYLAMELVNEFAPNHKVRVPSKQFIKYVAWKDIKLDDDEAVIQMFPVSSLPSQPGARLQRVQELLQGGFIDMATAKRLLEFPDIEAEQNLANAVLDDVDACISMILDDDKPTMPGIEKYQDVALIVSRATSSYLYAKHHGAEEERLQMMRDYIDLATNELTTRMAGMAAMQAGLPPTALGGGPPAAAGGGSVQNTVNVQPQAPTPAVPPVVA